MVAPPGSANSRRRRRYYIQYSLPAKRCDVHGTIDRSGRSAQTGCDRMACMEPLESSHSACFLGLYLKGTSVGQRAENSVILLNACYFQPSWNIFIAFSNDRIGE